MKTLTALTAEGILEQLTNANNEIKSYKDMDIDSIKKSASDWEGKYNKLLEEQENAKNEEIRSQRTNDFFKDIKFSCESAKAGVMAKFKENPCNKSFS